MKVHRIKLKGFTIIETLTSFTLLIIIFTIIINAFLFSKANPSFQSIQSIQKFKDAKVELDICHWPFDESREINNLKITRSLLLRNNQYILTNYRIESLNGKLLAQIIENEECIED